MHHWYKAVCCLFLFSTQLLFAQRKRDLLVASYPVQFVQQHMPSGTEWVRFPAYADRTKWSSLPEAYRKKIVADGEAVLGYKWQVVPASAYQEFVTTGDRNVMQDVYNANTSALRRLVLAELVEGKGRFLKQMVDGVWTLCEMSTWALSAHLYMQKKGVGLPDVTDPVIDLGAGTTSVLLAWTNYFFGREFDRISPLVSPRIRRELDLRILQPYYNRNDFWWMALEKEDASVNNWNIWCNYNVLTCILLTETDPQKRLNGIYKTMRSADKFINYYKDDGACEEGPAYWSLAGGMLYNYLDLLSTATGGAINKFNDPLVKNIGTYIAKAYISDRWYINYADASARLSPDAGLVYEYGKSVGDPGLQHFGSYLAVQQHWEERIPGETLQSLIRNLFESKEVLDGKAEKPMLAESWMPGTQIMAARDKAGTAQGFYFSALGGHNGESHNHNDVGSCILFYNGHPVLIDVGSENYTRQTFGPERYTIWTMQSAFHNLPLINGVQQHEGAKYAAKKVQFNAAASSVKFSLDIAAAYPPEARVRSWERSYLLNRGKSFTITDKFELEEYKGPNELHLMTSNKVEKKQEGMLQLTGDSTVLNLQYDPTLLTPRIEPVTVKDSRLLQSWPSTIYRIIFTFAGNKTAATSSLVITSPK